jgi:predicted TIM-barrel fold metal-dependent hydrolase
MSDQNRLRFIDSDGHVLEHPTEMVDFAPAEYRDRIWHIETDRDGTEWLVFDGSRSPANRLAVAGTAGMSAAENRRAMAGEMKYTEVKPAAYNAKARLEDMTEDHIDMSVLYPTMLLGIQSNPDVEFADVQCRAYNDWLAAHVADGEGRLFGAAALPQQDIERAAAELRRTAKLPGIVAAFIRPNPTADWWPFSDRVYDPLWRAASDTGLPLGLHPFFQSDLPGACLGMRLYRIHRDKSLQQDTSSGNTGGAPMADNLLFSQLISNPFDMMNSVAFLLGGGVCARFPDLRLIFLEANGGWIVPWLERLDHHCEVELYKPDNPPHQACTVGILPAPMLDQLRCRRVGIGLHR